MCSSSQLHQTGGSLLVGGCCSNGTPCVTRHRGSQWGEHKTGLGVRQQALQLGVPGAEWAAPGHDTRQASFTNLGGRAVLWGACPYLAHLPPGVPMLADQQNFPAKTLKLAIFGPRQNLTNAGGGRKCPTPPACPQHPPCGGGYDLPCEKKTFTRGQRSFHRRTVAGVCFRFQERPICHPAQPLLTPWTPGEHPAKKKPTVGCLGKRANRPRPMAYECGEGKRGRKTGS